ncbi:MAG: thymidylate kinase [Oscillospiraceae bacterium]|nr:thymidylate kinase [Oscillospiraceae bacterium]
MMGKLIVFEGTDGSGKATQSEMLCARLKRENIDFRKLCFPRYGEPSCTLVQMYLDGAFGSKPGDVNAYAASSFYAVDRYASYKQDWGKYYKNGGLLIADRYTTSNAVHQASKMPLEKRKAFFKWLFDYEYNLLELPEPTLVFYLDMPADVSEKMLRSRETNTGTQADIHEKDREYLAACREAGMLAVGEYGWRKVDCARDGEPRSVDEIHEEIYSAARVLIEK